MQKSFSYILILGLMLAGCAKGITNTSYPKTKEEREQERMGKLTGEEGLVLFGGKRGKSAADAINVNAYLWRATLDSVHFMPIITADPFGGTVLTDWYSSSSNANERIKFSIFIIGAELRSDALKVAAFKQLRGKNGEWKDVAPNLMLAKEMEEIILLKARDMKVKSL